MRDEQLSLPFGLPSLTERDTGRGQQGGLVASPSYYTRKPPKGVRRVFLNLISTFTRSTQKVKGVSAAASNGLRFEKKAIKFLSERYLNFLPAPVFSYWASPNGVIIPDGIIFDFESKRIMVVEIKLQHSADAFYQLTTVYLPLVQFAFPDWEVKGLEVCRYFHPVPGFPADFEVVEPVALPQLFTPSFKIMVLGRFDL